MRDLYRWALAGLSFLGLWIAAAIIQEALLILAGLFFAWSVLAITARERKPKTKRVYHWRNLTQPLNEILIFGSLMVHFMIQVALYRVGMDFLSVHLIVFLGLAPLHLLLVIRSVLEKPEPYNPDSKVIFTRRVTKSGFNRGTKANRKRAPPIWNRDQ